MQQAALSIANPFPPAVMAATKTTTSSRSSLSAPRLRTSRCPPIKAVPVPPQETSTVDYSSRTSVFPAEACDTVGGEACDVEMYPEVKLKPQAQAASLSAETRATSEPYDREYLAYDGPKTVFLEEACDDLGGEFCEPGYQTEPN